MESLENTLSRWHSLLRIRWARAVAIFLLILVMVMFPPAAWTVAEVIAAKKGYWAGLIARLADPVLWKRALIGGASFVVFESPEHLYDWYEKPSH